MNNENKTDWLFRELRREIGVMNDGERFPSVRQLIAKYDLSQVTVTSALEKLKETGLLKTQVGRGSFVNKPKASRPNILLLQQEWDSWSLINVRTELEKAALRYDFNLETSRFYYKSAICRKLGNYNADLIILDSLTNDQLTSDQITALTKSPVPVILSSYALNVNQINYVCGDNSAGGTLAAQYLASQGHSKIGLLYCEPHFLTSDSVANSFDFAAKANNCKITLLDCKMKSGDTPRKAIQNFAKKYAAGEYDFTAVFAISDHGALVAIEEFEKQGIMIPDDLGIIGFGNVIMPGIERITTIDTPRDKIAEEVILMANNILNNKQNFKTQINVVPNIVERGSVQKITHEKKHVFVGK